MAIDPSIPLSGTPPQQFNPVDLAQKGQSIAASQQAIEASKAAQRNVEAEHGSILAKAETDQRNLEFTKFMGTNLHKHVKEGKDPNDPSNVDWNGFTNEAAKAGYGDKVPQLFKEVLANQLSAAQVLGAQAKIPGEVADATIAVHKLDKTNRTMTAQIWKAIDHDKNLSPEERQTKKQEIWNSKAQATIQAMPGQPALMKSFFGTPDENGNFQVPSTERLTGESMTPQEEHAQKIADRTMELAEKNYTDLTASEKKELAVNTTEYKNSATVYEAGAEAAKKLFAIWGPLKLKDMYKVYQSDTREAQLFKAADAQYFKETGEHLDFTKEASSVLEQRGAASRSKAMTSGRLAGGARPEQVVGGSEAPAAPAAAPPAGAKQPRPAVGTKVGGFVYKGGDPKDKTSWVKE